MNFETDLKFYIRKVFLGVGTQLDGKGYKYQSKKRIFFRIGRRFWLSRRSASLLQFLKRITTTLNVLSVLFLRLKIFISNEIFN